MLSFKDKLGRQWICRVDVPLSAASAPLQSRLPIRSSSIQTGLSTRTSCKPSPMTVPPGGTVFAVCKDQADRLNITDVQFAEGLDGDTIEAATLALMEGIVEFFPLAKRRLLTKILNLVKQQRQQELVNLETMEKDGTLDSILASALAPSLTSSQPVQPHLE